MDVSLREGQDVFKATRKKKENPAGAVPSLADGAEELVYSSPPQLSCLSRPG